MRRNIATSILEFLNEKNQFDNLIKLSKDNVDDIRQNNKDIDKILSDDIFLNKNIYLKGGASRVAMQTYINGFSSDSIRDIDYCYIGSYDDYCVDMRKIDFHIDYENEMEMYFKTRDITLNEVLLNRESLIFTRRAYRDFNNKLINSKTNNVSGRLFSRMLLFSVRYNYDINKKVSFDYIDEFNLLVCLLKAYELNIEYKFYDICKYHEVTTMNTYTDFIVDLLKSVYGFNLYGREKYIAKDFVNLDKELVNDLYYEYPELKQEVEKITFDDSDYSMYMTKPNRIKNRHYKNY